MADVSAKDGSQETLVNLAGLLCSLVMVPVVTGNQGLIWTLYILFTCLHLFANFRAVTSVTMETFNQARLHIVTHHYLSSQDATVMSVKAANSREPVIWRTRWKHNIILGTSLRKLVTSWEEFQRLVALYKSQKYLLNVDMKKGFTYIVLHRDSGVLDQMKACYQAEIIDYVLQNNAPVHTPSQQQSLVLDNMREAVKHNDCTSLLSHSLKLADLTFDSFLSQCEHVGWKTSYALLGAEEWRAEWDLHGVNDKKTY